MNESDTYEHEQCNRDYNHWVVADVMTEYSEWLHENIDMLYKLYLYNVDPRWKFSEWLKEQYDKRTK